MRMAVPKETAADEHRVAIVPESCKKLVSIGYEISVESGAGEPAGFPDDEYRSAGVAIEDDPASLLRSADIVLKVTAPAMPSSGRGEIGWMRPGAIYLGSLLPLRYLEAVREL